MLTVVYMINKIFKKIFKIKKKDNTDTGGLDIVNANSKLKNLLTQYSNNPSEKTYQAVARELRKGNSLLYIPSENDLKHYRNWKIAEVGSKLKVTSVLSSDGVKTLVVFSEESMLRQWLNNKPTDYIALSSIDVIDICQENSIDRLIINIDQIYMFILDRDRNFELHKIQKEIEVKIGTPKNPLPQRTLGLLVDNFKKVKTIEECYQYAQVKGDDTSLVIAFKLSSNSYDAKTAALNCIEKVFLNMDLDQELDIFFIESQDLYSTIRNINNALFYSR